MELVYILYLLTLLEQTIITAKPRETMGRRRPGRRKNISNIYPKDISEQTEEDVLKKLRTNYDRNVPPMLDRPTAVKLGIFVLDFFSIKEQTMDYSVSMYLRQSWRDPRLSFIPGGSVGKTIRLPEGSWKIFWVPDTFFRNEKRATFHKITVANRLLRVDASGKMWYVKRITGTFTCSMTLEMFPLDTQYCPLQIESFGYTMDTMYFGWLPSPFEPEPPFDGLNLPQFDLVEAVLSDCSANYTSGAYPCAEIKFMIRRDVVDYIISTFVPSILVVMLSWVSFWIDIEGVPARVSLGLFTVQTIMLQIVGINGTLPRVSYIKAIDIWMIVCLTFTFAGLLEYAMVNVALRNGVRIRTPIIREPPRVSAFEISYHDQAARQPIIDSSCFRFPDITGKEGRLYTTAIDKEASKLRARKIDRVSRKGFPIAFLIFNIVYWTRVTVPYTSIQWQQSLGV